MMVKLEVNFNFQDKKALSSIIFIGFIWMVKVKKTSFFLHVVSLLIEVLRTDWMMEM